ncbi:hypothetical protein DFQ29_008451 [Apophysomyces sp. BC1021]|nr:hypothetical protein DFQ29_008451 [Apophysomyces sp. BC1021]
MIQFIPYLPSSTEGVTEEQWLIAREAWTTHLGNLLNKSDEEFVDEAVSNSSLHQFIETIHGAQLDGGTVEAEVSKRIFLVYIRAADLSATDSPLFSIAQLIQFSVLYGNANATTVRRVFSQILRERPALLDAVQESVLTVMECVRSMPSHLQRTRESMDRAHVVARVMDALVSASMDVGAIWEQQQGEIEKLLFACYSSLTSTLGKTSEVDDGLDLHVYLIKSALVSIFNTLTEIAFFRPLGFLSDREDRANVIQLDVEPVQADLVVDAFSEHLLSVIERSGLESTRCAFVDAPLIMDWEVEFSVTNKLARRVSSDGIVLNSLFTEDERIKFLELSMEQVRDSNISTENWAYKIKGRRRKVQDPTEDVIAVLPTENQYSKAATTEIADDDMYVQQTAKISQVQELFPDLGEGFIEACLSAGNGDVEMVIMQLLENTLPPSVASLDRSMERQRIPEQIAAAEEINTTYEEHDSVLSTRRNIFDNDEFDMFSRTDVDKQKVHLGKKSRGTAENMLNDKSFIESEKTNVLQRIYNMYEDEYDDTYDDINEVSGRVKLQAIEGDSEGIDTVKVKKEEIDPGILNESDLVHAFVDDREVFSRGSGIRKSAKRAELRRRTKMTDEQLEGWAIMFDRNPRKQRILDKYMLFDGSQEQVSQDISESQRQPRKENKRPPQSEAKERSYKDKNKARFGNHNRKKMHDKKLTKAGVAGV